MQLKKNAIDKSELSLLHLCQGDQIRAMFKECQIDDLELGKMWKEKEVFSFVQLAQTNKLSF